MKKVYLTENQIKKLYFLMEEYSADNSSTNSGENTNNNSNTSDTETKTDSNGTTFTFSKDQNGNQMVNVNNENDPSKIQNPLSLKGELTNYAGETNTNLTPQTTLTFGDPNAQPVYTSGENALKSQNSFNTTVKGNGNDNGFSKETTFKGYQNGMNESNVFTKKQIKDYKREKFLKENFVTTKKDLFKML